MTTIKQEFESNPVVYISGLMIAAFAAGLSTHAYLVEKQATCSSSINAIQEVLNQELQESVAEALNLPPIDLTLGPVIFEMRLLQQRYSNEPAVSR